MSELLVPGGTLFLREAHPIIWSLDEARDDGVLAIEYPYFETPDALVYQESGTYVDSGAAVFEHGVSHTWNHGVGEILTALLDAGLSIRCFVEHDTVPWQALPGQMVAVGSEWRLRDRPERLPHSYTLQAVKAG